jgi:hypothetical protein
MDLIISSVVSDLTKDHPYLAPPGKDWFKEPDEYDQTSDIIWEGNWVLREKSSSEMIKIQPIKTIQKPTTCKWKCPNEHIEDHNCYESHGGFDAYKEKVVEQQRQIVSKDLNPCYHVCNHKTHSVCSKSPCCDFFWHSGDCDFISEDREIGGLAWRYGNQ